MKLKWFDGKSAEPEDYNGGRDLEDLQDFVSSKTGIRIRKKAKLPSQVQLLTDQSFKGAVGSDKSVLVAFTAPWCGRKPILDPSVIQYQTELSRI